MGLSVQTLKRVEYIASITLNANNTAFQLPTQGGLIPNDRFMYGLRLQFEGRVTNAGSNNPNAVLADAPYSLIDTIDISGYHRPRGTKEDFLNVRLADLRELMTIYASGNAKPISTPSSLSTSASATNDIRFTVDVPFTPLNLSPVQQLLWLLDAPNYDSLTLTVRFADDKNIFSGQTSASTFSAYGSTTGNPVLKVSGIFAMAGAGKFAGFLPGRPWRYFQEYTSGDITGGATGSRLYNLSKGWFIRNVLAKWGVKATGVSSGNNAYSTLSNTIATNIKVYQGINKIIRYWSDEYALQQDAISSYGNSPDAGYGLIDFAQNGTHGEALRTTGLVAGPTGDVDLFLAGDLAGASNQGQLFMTEELRNFPGALTANISAVLAKMGANKQ